MLLSREPRQRVKEPPRLHQSRLRSLGRAMRAVLSGLLTNAKATGWIPIHALALSATLLWVTAYLFPREFEIPVKAASLVPNGGHAFAVRLVLSKKAPYLGFSNYR